VHCSEDTLFPLSFVSVCCPCQCRQFCLYN